jgi:hypothetical protein
MQRLIVLMQDSLSHSKEPAMTDFRALLADLRRPRLLIRAARFGLADYHRDRDLRRLVSAPTTPERAVPRLLQEEEQLEETRRAGDAAYSVARHIEVLIALMAEVRLLPRPRVGV